MCVENNAKSILNQILLKNMLSMHFERSCLLQLAFCAMAITISLSSTMVNVLSKRRICIKKLCQHRSQQNPRENSNSKLFGGKTC